MEHTFRLKLQEHSKNIRLKDLLVESLMEADETSDDGVPPALYYNLCKKQKLFWKKWVEGPLQMSGTTDTRREQLWQDPNNIATKTAAWTSMQGLCDSSTDVDDVVIKIPDDWKKRVKVEQDKINKKKPPGGTSFSWLDYALWTVLIMAIIFIAKKIPGMSYLLNKVGGFIAWMCETLGVAMMKFGQWVYTMIRWNRNQTLEVLLERIDAGHAVKTMQAAQDVGRIEAAQISALETAINTFIRSATYTASFSAKVCSNLVGRFQAGQIRLSTLKNFMNKGRGKAAWEAIEKECQGIYDATIKDAPDHWKDAI